MSIPFDCPKLLLLLVLSPLVLAALLAPGQADAQLCDLYLADAKASSLVPPSESGARASVSGQFDTCLACGLTFTVAVHDVVGLSGSPTVVRVHSGNPAENGPLVYEWTIPEQDPSYLPFDVAFDQEYCAALSDTLLSVVIATADHPEGEVRGQLVYQPASPTLRTTWGRIRVLYR
jgi:hypothetical protein